MSPVRNIRGIGGTKPIPVYMPIPPTKGALYKIEVVRSDSSTDDITDIILDGEITDSVNDSIGSFSFTIDNSGENYTDVWTGNNVVNVYIDYDTSATTLRFRGLIEKVSYKNNQVQITGRTDSLKLLNVTVTKSYTNIETSVILKELFDDYATDFTYTNISTSSTNVTVNWYQKPFMECVQELTGASGFDFYIDCNLDAHYFESGSVKNTNEAVFHEMNILSVDDFGQDFSLIKNRVRVEGKEIAGTPLFATSESTDSSYGITSGLGVREKIISDQSITTMNQAQERADYELALALNPNSVGECECVGLSTIQQGEQIFISSPSSNLQPNYYTINQYNHKFSGMMTTTLTINKESLKIPKIIKQRISTEKDLSKTENPNEMKYSWNINFSEESGTHSNTEIITEEGYLKTDGSSTGTWISDTKEVSSDVEGIELRVNGDTLSGTKIRISTDGGVTYKQIWGVGAYSSFPSGKKLKLQVDLASASTQIKGIAVLYK